MTREIGHREVAEWLRSPETSPEDLTDQDWDLIIGDCLDGDFPGHIAFYLHETIPSPRRREYLLNGLYVMAWTRFCQMSKAPVALASLRSGVAAAEASGNQELLRWAASVNEILTSGRSPNYAFWCDRRWKRPETSAFNLSLWERLKRALTIR